ncbi:glycosyltransferase family 2 protein [Paraburkholderia xenovorans]|uniref:glycosyltransferase family 2 protein n=1 Tax=Paraburkholderia xenovorans TaxID=36873 RepID=UPI0038B75FB4
MSDVKPTVSVVIVNYNGGQLLNECVQSLRGQTYPIERILIVDNASTDGSLAVVEMFPGVEKMPLGYNSGFAEGNNVAFERCDTDFVALLNPDAIADPHWLEELIATAAQHPEAGSFGCRQMQPGTDGLLDGTGDVYHASGLVWRRGYNRPMRARDLEAAPIFSACGGAVLYRTLAIKAAGGFDSRFFCYVEDVDLGFRLRLAGWQCRYVPSALVYHVGGVSSGGPQSEFSLYHGHRNLVWTFVKNMPGFLFWLFLPSHIALNVATVVIFAARGYGRILLKAKYDAVRGLSDMIRARKDLQANRKVGALSILKALDYSPIPNFRELRRKLNAVVQPVCRRLNRR